MAGAELILLKFRDLNSSASVMLGDGICVCGCLGDRVWVVTGYKGVYVVNAVQYWGGGGCRGVGLTTGGC
jgi:hypothetical protein